MTLETLQNEMIAAMKKGDKFRKTAISGYIAAIKKAAIDKGMRDNISEELVNEVLAKLKKQAKESLDSCPENRTDLLVKYQSEYAWICEFAPSLISDPNRIAEIIRDEYDGEMNKGKIMKYLNTNFKGHMDMGVASKVVGEMLK